MSVNVRRRTRPQPSKSTSATRAASSLRERSSSVSTVQLTSMSPCLSISPPDMGLVASESVSVPGFPDALSSSLARLTVLAPTRALSASEKITSSSPVMAAAAAITGEEEVIFSEADRARVGAKTVKRANELLSASGKPGTLTLSDATRPMSGGLILKQGDIEVNCTVDTLLDLSRSELAARVAEVLFEG